MHGLTDLWHKLLLELFDMFRLSYVICILIFSLEVSQVWLFALVRMR